MMGCVLVFAVASVAAHGAGKTKSRRVVVSPKAHAIALANVARQMTPCSSCLVNADALAPFFDRLARANEVHELVRVLQFGDSHTASDDLANGMRLHFQSRHGNGGPGFVTAGQIRYYRRLDVQIQNSFGWVVQGPIGHVGDQRHGLSGLSITADRPGETASIKTSTEHLELWFLRQPEGGPLGIEIDGQPVATVETQGELSTGVYRLNTELGEHMYAARTLSDKQVRLFGWIAENQQGLTWETLGINGAQSKIILDWDKTLWSEQLGKRDPALIVVAYGTNESVSPKWNAADYRGTLVRLINEIRDTVPGAAVLLLGPPDCGPPRRFPNLSQVIVIQREVAREKGVAFWDWRAHMGGPGSNGTWARAGLMRSDYTHFTSEGYRIGGSTLASELDLEFQRNRAGKTPE